MNNMQIYSKTLKFSFIRILLGFAGLLVFAAITLAGYFITRSMSQEVNLITTGICAIIGIIGWWLIGHYIGYLYKAGQIAMITKGVTEGSMPDDVVASGVQAVKERFLTVNVYFAVTAAISGITNQLTRGINAAAGALGGLAGDDGKGVAGGIGSAISAFVAIVLEYVNYCCLGWVFYKKDQNAFKSTCDGGVIYFQNWKTMLANAGKVFGITIASFIVIGGIFFLLFGAILPHGILTAAEVAQIDANFTPEDVRMIIQVALAVIVWAFVHSALVKPYLLVSVMRKYIDKAKTTTLSFDLYEKLSGISAKFRNALSKGNA